MKIALCVCAAVVAGAGASTSLAALSQTLTGPSTQTYSNGGGSGFGGVLGPASISFGVSGGNITISTNIPAGSFGSNIAVIRLDTRNGGVGDFEMNDTADGGRRASSSPAANALLNEPIGPWNYAPGAGGGQSDFALGIGSFGAVLFELVPGTNLNFVAFNAAQTITFPLSAIGSPNLIDWFSYYTSDSQFLSNETLPASPVFNSGGNPGFNTGVFQLENFNRFLIPSPGSLALLGLGGLAAARRRR
jgi:hypothetical protein